MWKTWQTFRNKKTLSKNTERLYREKFCADPISQTRNIAYYTPAGSRGVKPNTQIRGKTFVAANSNFFLPSQSTPPTTRQLYSLA